MGEFRYTLNSAEKFDCPDCGESGRFVKYLDRVTGEYLEGDYGKCDRINSCGYHLRPETKFINNETTEVKVPLVAKSLFESSTYPKKHYKTLRAKFEEPNTFMRGIGKYFGKEAALKAWNQYQLANFWKGGVVFPYIFNDEIKTGKIMFYDNTLHRIKERNAGWLHSTFKLDDWFVRPWIDEKKFTVAFPLFGWDLIGKAAPETPICLVEAEKTAIICSIVFPEYVWVAAGSLNWLQPYKFVNYSARRWYIFPDLGTMTYENEVILVEDYWKIKIEKIQENYIMMDTFVDYYPSFFSEEEKKMCRELQWDIADFIMFFIEKNDTRYVEEMKKRLQNFGELK